MLAHCVQQLLAADEKHPIRLIANAK
jgi:hypothetical protein